MEEDPYDFEVPADEYHADEYLARFFALEALVAEAHELGDEDRLQLYQETLNELESGSPNARARRIASSGELATS